MCRGLCSCTKCSHFTPLCQGSAIRYFRHIWSFSLLKINLQIKKERSSHWYLFYHFQTHQHMLTGTSPSILWLLPWLLVVKCSCHMSTSSLTLLLILDFTWSWDYTSCNNKTHQPQDKSKTQHASCSAAVINLSTLGKVTFPWLSSWALWAPLLIHWKETT